MNVNWKVYWFPGATALVSSTRAKPQAVLSWGFCDPRRYGLLGSVDGGFHVVVPIFFIVMEAVAVWPGHIVEGTDGGEGV